MKKTDTPDPVAQFRAKDDIFTPSNLISIMRAMFVLPAIFCIMAHLYLLVAAIFIAAFITDLLDGMIARMTKTVSEVGKIVDPLADKIFVGAVVIAMALVKDQNQNALLPLWFLAAIIGRDLILVLGGVWAKRKLGVVLPSNYPGKAAVVAIGLTILTMVLQQVFHINQNVIDFGEGLSITLMVASLIVYWRRLARLLAIAK